jgi:phosphocarrier protein
MQTLDVVVNNPAGLHMRIASQIVKLVDSHKAQVRLSCRDCRHADGCSVFQLLMLEATRGSALHVEVEGRDERAVAQQLRELFSDGAGI